MKMGSGANGGAQGCHMELCQLPSEIHPTSLDVACGAAFLLLITPNSTPPVQFNTSVTFGKAFYSESQPEISSKEKKKSNLCILNGCEIATEKPRPLPPLSTHTRIQPSKGLTFAEPSEKQYTDLFK